MRKCAISCTRITKGKCSRTGAHKCNVKDANFVLCVLPLEWFCTTERKLFIPRYNTMHLLVGAAKAMRQLGEWIREEVQKPLLNTVLVLVILFCCDKGIISVTDIGWNDWITGAKLMAIIKSTAAAGIADLSPISVTQLFSIWLCSISWNSSLRCR